MSKRRLFPILITLVFCLLFSGCGGYKSHVGQSYSFHPGETMSREKILKVMDRVAKLRQSFVGDETHWSRKVMFMGANAGVTEGRLVVTLLDGPQGTLDEALFFFKKYPCDVNITNHVIVEQQNASGHIIVEHKYIVHEDGSLEEYHYVERDPKVHNKYIASLTWKENITDLECW